ncbi:tributyrin esterase [Cohnella xylanilytica]|uniref:Esterase family protein n=1 Tax=Cohnella xylanilytica TaxID=557555 RepID=A0A841U594_9BACL|nr:alpha/beta hydrolase family protein [Cohnella xylanilytica]MBB6693473.1 esterase family protein [Cohnella xylanilytica]GIO16619.1 tributyrin esterase [Cohnella xylanilytica]
MALIQCHFFSETLGLSTAMTVILPQRTSGQVGMAGVANRDRHPTLWLLHGGSDDDTIWLRRTSIERYVSELGLAVVMPQAHLSFYTNMEHGGQYGTFLMEELPRIARSFFPLSDAREDNFVAGLSMGGYGAFKWALTQPDRFAAAAGLSTANFSTAKFGEMLRRPRFLELVYGTASQEGTDNDLYHLIRKCSEAAGEKPKFYQTCGTSDFLYEHNLELKNAFEASTLDFTYDEEPGTHDWAYWDKTIQDVLAWLPLRKD